MTAIVRCIGCGRSFATPDAFVAHRHTSAPSHTTSDGARPARSMPSRLGVPGGALSQLPTGTWQ